MDDGERAERPVVNPAAVASIVTEPASAPVIVLVATPFETVALPVPDTVPAPDCLANAIAVELSERTVFPAASGSSRSAPRRAGGQVGGRPGDRDLRRRAVHLDDGADAGRVADGVGAGQHVLVAAGAEVLSRRAADVVGLPLNAAAPVVRERCRVACEHARPQAGPGVGVVRPGIVKLPFDVLVEPPPVAAVPLTVSAPPVGAVESAVE